MRQGKRKRKVIINRSFQTANVILLLRALEFHYRRHRRVVGWFLTGWWSYIGARYTAPYHQTTHTFSKLSKYCKYNKQAVRAQRDRVEGEKKVNVFGIGN